MMIERFKAYFEKLEGLSDDELDRSAEKLVLEEKRSTALLIAHIAEISRRKVELERGYKNIFDYCVRRLGLSEGSVALRIQVANVARRFPQVLVAISENRISLTVAGRLAPRLCEENVEKLLRDSAGMTRLEVEEYLVRLAPKPEFTASIRKKPSSASESERVRLEAGEAQAKSERPSRPRLEETGNEAPEDIPGLLQPARADVYNFRFSAGKAFKEKLERLAEVLGIENPSGNMAHVLERALELALERKDPKAKRERRLERERKRLAAGAKKSCPDKNPAGEEALASRDGPAPSRYIPAAVRERALERAGYRCEYTGPGGTRCTSRTGLEIEHELPFAIFRSHDERHLRVFCPGHNRLSAEQVYGAEFVRARIEERRRCRDANATHPPRSAWEEIEGKVFRSRALGWNGRRNSE